MEYFVTGSNAKAGKTLISALLCQTLQADYWKPFQVKGSENDCATVQQLISPHLSIHSSVSENVMRAMGDHALRPSSLMIPEARRPLIIEGTGGLLSPISPFHTNADLLQVWDIPVIVVSRASEGLVNETMLTIEVLRQRGIPLAGVIFNGHVSASEQSFIKTQTGAVVLGSFAEEVIIHRERIKELASEWQPELESNLDLSHPINSEIEQKVRWYYSKKESRPKAAF